MSFTLCNEAADNISEVKLEFVLSDEYGVEAVTTTQRCRRSEELANMFPCLADMGLLDMDTTAMTMTLAEPTIISYII
jgi:hypothetical protein